MIRRISTFITLFVCICISCRGQTDTFKHLREIQGVTDEWHKLELPVDVISHSKRNLDDLRILQIESKGDTLEAPYFVELNKPISTKIDVPITIINRSSKNGAHYFTIKLKELVELNKIDLSFGNSNFDWRVKLEGSQNNNEWFSILDDYRILSINNSKTNYKYTSLSFPNSEYAYYRLMIATGDQPNLVSASVSMNKSMDAKLHKYIPKSLKRSRNKKSNTSIIDFTLADKYPISSIQLFTKFGGVDYVRPLNIKVLRDSFNTEKGWKYNYSPVSSGTFNSFEPNRYRFSEVYAKQLRIEISHGDNQPIEIDHVDVEGYKRQLTARFSNASSDYFLAYGNANKFSPSYDLMLFKERIPNDIQDIQLGPIEYSTAAPFIEKEEDKKLWLWAIMGIVMVILGLFTLKMMKNS